MVRLEKIPLHIQNRYNIGESVEADVSGESMGGNFSFKNKDGRVIRIDAVELSGTNIIVRNL